MMFIEGVEELVSSRAKLIQIMLLNTVNAKKIKQKIAIIKKRTEMDRKRTEQEKQYKEIIEA